MQSLLRASTLRTCIIFATCGMLVTTCVEADPDFPKVRVATVEPNIEGRWIASPIVALGEVNNITSYGHQRVDHLPAPTMPGIHDLYWCQGDFKMVAVVKGELQGGGRKYLWASTIPGCQLVDNNPELIYHRLQTKTQAPDKNLVPSRRRAIPSANFRLRNGTF